MTKDETLKLALDALERSVATCLDPYSHEQVKSRPEHFINKAITALRLAIDVENMVSESTYKEQLETKDKPVSCAECGADGGHALYCVACAEKFIAQTETKDEFVAWEQFYPDIGKPQIAFNAEVVGYVAPQRTWVGLTDDEMLMIYGQQHEGKKYSLGRMVQQALKEKNT